MTERREQKPSIDTSYKRISALHLDLAPLYEDGSKKPYIYHNFPNGFLFINRLQRKQLNPWVILIGDQSGDSILFKVHPDGHVETNASLNEDEAMPNIALTPVDNTFHEQPPKDQIETEADPAKLVADWLTTAVTKNGKHILYDAYGIYSTITTINEAQLPTES